jgi:hypothetical protein
MVKNGNTLYCHEIEFSIEEITDTLNSVGFSVEEMHGYRMTKENWPLYAAKLLVNMPVILKSTILSWDDPKEADSIIICAKKGEK